MKLETALVHSGLGIDQQHRSASPPIYQTSTFGWESLDQPPEYMYTRYQNPNRTALEHLLRDLEGGAGCTAVASGVAAMVAALSLFKSGDSILVGKDIYGGTTNISNLMMPRQGISVTRVDTLNPAEVEAAITPETKGLVFETPANPTLRLTDIAAMVAIAKKHDLITIIDNTFCTPLVQKPLTLGVDIAVHSTTKAIAGHSDVIGGAVVSAQAEHAEFIDHWCTVNGACPSPFDCWLTLRGARTMNLRVRKQIENAEKVAQFLVGHSLVEKVNYPGLDLNPDHKLAKQQMSAPGGVLSFEVKGSANQAKVVAESCQVFLLAASVGGIESLVAYPPQMSHYSLNDEELKEAGISPNLLRLSLGIEDADDLCEDLDQALRAAF